MKNFSIEVLAEQIFFEQTKEHFQEVLKSYSIGNYRSATVMLYSVVMCDLIYKLQQLRDVYNDKVAIEILQQIQTMQTQNPTSADWEKELIKQINDRTEIFETYDYANLLSLQQHRHLSAHPVLNQIQILYSPNKETISADIRNMLEGILTKPPLLTKKIFDTLLTKIERLKNHFPDKAQFKRYLVSRFLNNLRVDIINEVFKSLWSVIFKVDNERCNQNREMNFNAIEIILEIHENDLLVYIQRNQEYFSNISEQEGILEYLLRLLISYPKIYQELKDNAKVIIENAIAKNPNHVITCWFLKKTPKEHIDYLINEVKEKRLRKCSGGSFKLIEEILVHDGCQNEALAFIVERYSTVELFDIADDWYENCVEPNLNNFSAIQLEELVKACNQNSQIYNRRAAKWTNRKIKETVESVIPAFDFTHYMNFTSSIE